MKELWHSYNVFANFENLEDHARTILTRAGLWEAFGADGWGPDGNLSMFERNHAAHRTANRRRDVSPQVRRLIAAHHRQDYALFAQLYASGAGPFDPRAWFTMIGQEQPAPLPLASPDLTDDAMAMRDPS